jgi:hypothetical protein
VDLVDVDARRDGDAVVISACDLHGLDPYPLSRTLPHTTGGRWALVIEHSIEGCVMERAEILRVPLTPGSPPVVVASESLNGGRAELVFERRDAEDLYVILGMNMNEHGHTNPPGCRCASARIGNVRLVPR